MSEVTYNLDQLHNLVNFGLRSNMITNPLANKKLPELVNSFYDDLIQKGSPLKNNLYKNMMIKSVADAELIAGATKENRKEDWLSNYGEDYDIVIDDGFISDVTNGSQRFRPYVYDYFRTFDLFSKYSKISLYQPYFTPTNRLSDYAVLNSTGPVGIKFYANKKYSQSICYADHYKDKDVNCVFAIIDVGKNSSIYLDEFFENKSGVKLYKILYVVRDNATLKINRKHDYENKDTSCNVIDSKFIQFPGSKVSFEVFGEGSKHNQDILEFDIYDNCDTTVIGNFNLFDNYVNNMLVNINHLRPKSKSIVDVRTIGDDNSHSSFIGKINILKEAEDTWAHLENKNLMVSKKATMITEPQLDINTKEVVCSHGCTVSNIDKQMLYYLQSRGLGDIESEELLKRCFITT